MNCLREPKDVWDTLEEDFAPTEDEDCYELEEEFKQGKMVDQYGNPTDWFIQLEEINAKMGNIEGGKYTKTDDNIKLQIRMNLPEDVYSEVITSFKNYSSMTLKEVKKEIKQFYCRMNRTDKIKEIKSESIMQVKNMNKNKTNRKSKENHQFKGKCFNCGEPGHKACKCPKPKAAYQGKKNKKNISCFICGQNHYASQCPMRRDKVKQANVFVEMTNVIDKDKFMEEQIKSLTELEKVQLVNRILGNMGANELFEPEGEEPIHPGVLEAAYNLLNDWMKQDNYILRIEYNGFVTDNKNKRQTEKKVINETTKSVWEKGKSFEG